MKTNQSFKIIFEEGLAKYVVDIPVTLLSFYLTLI